MEPVIPEGGLLSHRHRCNWFFSCVGAISITLIAAHWNYAYLAPVAFGLSMGALEWNEFRKDFLIPFCVSICLGWIAGLADEAYPETRLAVAGTLLLFAVRAIWLFLNGYIAARWLMPRTIERIQRRRVVREIECEFPRFMKNNRTIVTAEDDYVS